MMGAGTSTSTSEADEPSYFGELEVLYSQLDAEVGRHAPVCRISGRCCRFREYGHTLFLSAPECEYLVSRAPHPSRALDDGETCPWQDERGRCTARDARPMGCRVYFCDPDYQGAAPVISEDFIARLKRMVHRHGLSWSYAPLHHHLKERSASFRFPDAEVQAAPE